MAVGKFYYAITSQSILVNRCIVNEKNNKVAEKKRQRNEKNYVALGSKISASPVEWNRMQSTGEQHTKTVRRTNKAYD